MCYYQNVNNDITLDSFRPVLHWEKCGEILFFSKILCFLEKSLLSFREKSYFFEKNVISRKILFFLEKDKIFSWFFPVCTQPILWVILIYILLNDNCFLIGLSPRIPRNPGTEFSIQFPIFGPPQTWKVDVPQPPKTIQILPMHIRIHILNFIEIRKGVFEITCTTRFWR